MCWIYIYIYIYIEFREGKKATDTQEIARCIKKARMGIAHIWMYEVKMAEIKSSAYHINKPFYADSINKKEEGEDFIYF